MAGLFDPFELKATIFRNRVMMSPMIQVSADELGFSSDWHLVHYGARAVGGAALVMLEATAVESCGRITVNDLGLWRDEHIDGLQRIVAFCQEQGAQVGVQLAHAGRKAWSRNDGVGPEPAVAPSALPFEPHWPPVRVLDRDGVRRIVDLFASSARRAARAGFDVIELHAAHGYLLNQFLSPLTNQRDDEYGGDFQRRLTIVREVMEAVKPEIGQRLLFVRVSATDYDASGIDLEMMVRIAVALRGYGADLIDVSSGGSTPRQPGAWRGYQVPMAETIRRGADIPTAAVGLVVSAELAEEIIRNGRADMVAFGRQLLREPYFALHAARDLGVDIPWPMQYERAKRY